MPRMELFRKKQVIYELAVGILSLVSLINLVPLTLEGKAEASRALALGFDRLLCVVFLMDFFYRLKRASSRKVYFFKQGGWLDLLSCMAWFDVFRLGRLSHLARLYYLLRSLKVFRGIIPYLIKNNNVSAPVLIALITSLIIFLTSTLILYFENAPDSSIKTPLDAVWWSVVTLTTVGYGNVVPITFNGRILGIVVMIYGVAFYGGISGLLASYFIELDDQNKEEVYNKRLVSIEKKLDNIIKHMDVPTKK
ncbi:MAG: ion channel [Proteobacteria bacterium]|nr:ion channel [Pseudomonadota bacterium]